MTEITDILDSGEVIDYGSSLIGVQQHPLATGIPTWDEACDETGGRGLGDWWYVVLGGAPNAGKTQLMMYLARQASEQGLKPGVVTMETPKRGLQRQVYSNLSSFNYYDLLPHRWEEGDALAKVKQLGADIEEYRNTDQPARSLLIADYNRSPSLADIMAAIDTFFEGFAAGDSTMMYSVVDRESRLVITADDKDGNPTMTPLRMQDFIPIIIRPREEKIRETYWAPEIRVEENLAAVWLKYNLWIGDRIDHCGNDHLQLFRSTDGWKIIAIADTQLRDGCTAHYE